MSSLAETFSSLSPTQKASFLAKVAQYATACARDAYIKDYDAPDGVALRKANEFIHRVVGYIPIVLAGTEGKGQDASMIAMITESTEIGGYTRSIPEWLAQA